jgi:hypothetical protein
MPVSMILAAGVRCPVIVAAGVAVRYPVVSAHVYKSPGGSIPQTAAKRFSTSRVSRFGNLVLSKSIVNSPRATRRQTWPRGQAQQKIPLLLLDNAGGMHDMVGAPQGWDLAHDDARQVRAHVVRERRVPQPLTLEVGANRGARSLVNRATGRAKMRAGVPRRLAQLRNGVEGATRLTRGTFSHSCCHVPFRGLGGAVVRTLPCCALPCLAVPCRARPCPAVPCLALPCPAAPGPDIHHIRNGARFAREIRWARGRRMLSARPRSSAAGFWSHRPLCDSTRS